MKDVIETNVKGVAVYINEALNAYMLFSTDSIEYSSHSVGVYALKESEPCLVITKNKMIRVDSFSVHVWNAKARTHNYTFSFNNVGELDPAISTGEIEYEYVDSENSNDKANWKSEIKEREKQIECIPLTLSANNMWRLTDDGELNLKFKFSSNANET